MVKMYIGMAGRGPLVGKNMNVMPSFGKLMGVASYKLLGTTIENKFLSDDGYFHYESEPKN